MGEVERAGDDRTFRLNCAGESLAGLQERVKEKLKEFMGDYTDDTLVEYVIVLLRNGRGKEEAKRELNVFLGDDSDSFVSWLWDHLSLNLHLYTQPNESLTEEVVNRKVTTNDHYGISNLEMVPAGGTSYIDSEHEGEKSVNISRSRRNREWKSLASEMTGSFPLRSTVIEALHSREKTGQRPDVSSSSSPRPQVSKKRSRDNERQPLKRDVASLPKLAPSRRLLEFAVRDAVKIVQKSSSNRDAVKIIQKSSSNVEPTMKRLRSVVSTSVDTKLDERLQRPRSKMRIPVSASVALKAAAEAAEDVTKSRNAGSVFDRLGRVKDTPGSIDQSPNMNRAILQDAEDEEFGQSARSAHVNYNHKIGYDGDFDGSSSMLNKVDDMAVDSTSDNDGYDDFGISSDHGLDASQYAYSANKESSLTVHYNVPEETDAVVKKAKLIQQETPPTTLAKPSSKIVNISVNVNTWKPANYQVSRNSNEIENQMVDDGEQTIAKPNVRILKDNTSSIAGNDNEMAATNIQKESQKPQLSTPEPSNSFVWTCTFLNQVDRSKISVLSNFFIKCLPTFHIGCGHVAQGVSYTASPSEDVDSRTIFVSNVHFAATKDTLSRHFNKFGEVLKVIIVTDPATCQPIGSAYVEFLRKESAELALSLNGTSFMSRILKVVRRSSVEAPVIGWPRIARASPFASRFGRMPFPRGILTGAFRPRLPVKPGARSLQWKRGTVAPQTAGSPRNTPNSIAGRNLTYVRPEKT
ncbi:uncharacterized protein LOC110106244 isoform X1 [Dendrobium catenatum]|uniref:uncharacterized protein LOC110106244 isoform X1 n=1 Tax=Dendrobium catenatum TaxID=906689 RepID=UPI00109F371F|nr:uncharacterized protein LOC110106244 isoform X1 [Dendrobium catenatum]